MLSDTISSAPASRASLSIGERDRLVDRILVGLAAMPIADRLDLLSGIVSTLHGMSPKGRELLAHRARLTFWRTVLDLARMDAGQHVKGQTTPAGRSVSATDLRRHLERKAWSAATVLPVRTLHDLLPRELHGLADSIAAIVTPAAPRSVQH